MLDIGFYIFYILLFIAVASAIFFPILNAIKQPAMLGKSAIGLGAIVVLFVVSYALSGSEVNLKSAAAGISEGISKLIGAGLIMFYITLFLAILALIYSEINKALK
jgi:uncharacterized membrane protein